MNNNLLEITNEIKKMEERAQNDYSEIISFLSDAEIIEKITAIKDEEKEHSQICDKILEIVSSQ